MRSKGSHVRGIGLRQREGNKIRLKVADVGKRKGGEMMKDLESGGRSKCCA